MKLDFLLDAIRPSLEDIEAGLKASQGLLELGLRRAARLPVAVALQSRLQAPLLYITDRTDHALMIGDELALWSPEIPRFFFPEPTPLFYENASWGLSTRRDRLAVLTLLASYHLPGSSLPAKPPIIIASVRAVMTRTLSRREFLKHTRTLKVGQVAQPGELARTWVDLGYERVNTVVSIGQFARRGGIIDIWPPAEASPFRLEFFGDEIETIRSFDPASQRTRQAVERLQIMPAREFITDPEILNRILGETKDDAFTVNEFYIPLFHPLPSGIIEYLPRQALVVFDDLQAVQAAVEEIDEQSAGLRKDYQSEGILPADFPIPYLTWTEIQDTLPLQRTLNLSGSIHLEDSTPSPAMALADRFAPETRFGGRLKPLMDYLIELGSRNEQVLVISRQATRLAELWSEQSPEVGGRFCPPEFIEGSLAEGWIFTDQQGRFLHLLTDGEVFGWRRPEPRPRHRPVAEMPESAYADLRPGDWVVHIDHGIGLFVDLVTRTVDGHEREYLCIEYAEGDQLFVPVYQADRLTRYVGPDGRQPTPTRLGSSEWRTVRGNVREAVVEVAQDLLLLYAQRQVVPGFPFEKDTPWQQELEASFPYVETEDQVRVIGEVKRDMESPRPMDRLICGDVGYGKTEVALRAAFKAVMNGKQVAILVPTTVLAQQHYHTFCERLAAFPVEVEMLSRFRTPMQQREILHRLAEGAIDIVIGTHRLIQDDIHFKNLGLLIIDEEQRFGVSHKEKLKKMRTEVDVLTLTATPIPRTLYMALTGVRDISTINTPPEERLPVVTHVGPYSPRLVRQAILRELERGGQVFFVHNRVHTIEGMRRHLEKLVPEARLAVAHGQMPEHELSERMEQFTRGEVDVLLSTSIIESGLDIPNANTLIVDRADTFGLAQLYQLRGRVGRGAQRAYAYFFRHPKIHPTADGRERLETIAENTQLGAGFSVAMRDLEIRGAGDILGTRQHGNIAAVGFHLYTRMLADAVRRIRLEQKGALPDQAAPLGELELAQEIRMPVTIELPLPIGIPVDYVPDQDSRLRLYRRIADIRSQPELDAMFAEFTDRFGPPPEPVVNLLYQIKIKLLAEKAGIVSVTTENGQLVLRYPPLPEGAPQREFPEFPAPIRTGKNAIWLPLERQQDWKSRLEEVFALL